MDTLTAGALGVLVGLGLAVIALVLVRLSERGERPTEPQTPPASQVPDGVVDVLAVLRDGAIVIDTSGSVVKTSAAAVAYGLVRGNTLSHQELRSLALEVHQHGTIREVELELARGPLGQGRMLVGVRIAPIGRDLVLALVDDRTKARRVEEVRRDFVVNVSHELKTPVGGLALLAEAVEHAAEDPVAVQRFARRMKTESTRLTRLVTEIVDLSRLQTADLPDPLMPVNVATCAEEAVEHTLVVAGEHRITVSATAPAERVMVAGDPELIATAIRNLVTNAINYSGRGSHIAVVTRRRDDLVEVSVTDQGQGITPEDQERIFERFYRVDAARSRATGGTGLGLSIVKHICENLGGDVIVWSQVGQGATFTIRLPAIDLARTEESAEAAALSAAGPDPEVTSGTAPVIPAHTAPDRRGTPQEE